MTDDLHLRRKWTLRAHGEQVVFIKHRIERAAHVFMKAFLWALYLPQYPNIVVEIRIDDRYKPDVVSLNIHQQPVFWGEAGQIGRDKIRSLARRYCDTHFAFAKWDTSLDPLADMVSEAVEGLKRTAPFDLLTFASGSAQTFIGDKGHITISFENIKDFRRIGPDPPDLSERLYWKP